MSLISKSARVLANHNSSRVSHVQLDAGYPKKFAILCETQ